MARVMIVEDAEFMRMVVKDILLKHGHEVVAEVADGDEAIQIYLETKPDLVIMDIVTPENIGVIPESSDWRNTLDKFLLIDMDAKVAMSSSLGQRTLITESMKIGSMGFIVKPFEHDGMIDVIRKIGEPN
jgi:two-component system chemotaxis response regulator CheY